MTLPVPQHASHSQLLRVAPRAGGLKTSRFILTSATSPIEVAGSVTRVLYDAALNGFDSFNDLGLAEEWASTGNFGVLDGDYLIAVKVRLLGDAGFTGGNARCDIVDGGAPGLPITWSLAINDDNVVINQTDVRRYTAGGNQGFVVEVALQSPIGPSSILIVEASVAITKLS
jgi:hypothetical protein